MGRLSDADRQPGVGPGFRHRTRARRGFAGPAAGPITAWWIAWIFATGLAIFASATSFTTRPQGIADNTVTTIITYLLGVAVLVLLWQVFDAFVRKPVERPLHRWVIMAPTRRPARRIPIRPHRLSRNSRNRQHGAMTLADGAHGGHPFVVAHRGRRPTAPSTPWPPTNWRCGRAPTASNATFG